MDRIVVVEDTPVLAAMMTRMLHLRGYHVQALYDGLDLIEQLRRTSPALVLIDMSLPVKDGWQLIEEIRRTPDICHLPVIAMTSHGSDDEVRRVVDAGYTDVVRKPFDLTEFWGMVEAYVPQTI